MEENVRRLCKKTRATTVVLSSNDVGVAKGGGRLLTLRRSLLKAWDTVFKPIETGRKRQKGVGK